MEQNIVSFWEYLTENKIEIPIIQRDYAQGREGKESLRKTFLKSLYDALMKSGPYSESPLKLDFIYGSKNNSRILPLDGQQRLTTLWLLHWYIALMAGVLEEASSTLANFSYETRISSREFFSCLSNADNFKNFSPEVEHVRNYIERQTWFFREWRNDPTINAALRMISGYREDPSNFTKKEQLKIIQKNETKDGISKLFESSKPKEYFIKLWMDLISDTPPIIFYQLPLDKFNLTDDLYIKMNARGEELSFFDNFKADLIGYLYERVEKEEDETLKKHWNSLLDVRNGIPIKLDTSWAAIFWKYKTSILRRNDIKESDDAREDLRIDEIFYAFINRFFWNYFILAKDENQKYILEFKDGEINNNPSYAHLNERQESKDNPVPKYESFDVYRFMKAADKTHLYEENELKEMYIPIDFFDNLVKVLDRLEKIEVELSADLHNNWLPQFEFIPKYTETNSTEVTTIGQLQRILFFAVCKYLLEGDYDQLTFRQWMRVVFNLISGVDVSGLPQIRSIEQTRIVIETLNKLSSHEIYTSLQQVKVANSSVFEQRLIEEKEKANKILSKDKSKNWENLIIEAENWGFFRGSIRFLFHNENGDLDWQNFITKFESAKEFFKKDSNINDNSCLALECGKNLANTYLLKTFFSYFEPSDMESLWSIQTFNNKATSWLYYLLNPSLRRPVNNLLMKIKPSMIKNDTKECGWAHDLYLLTSTGLLDYTIVNIPEARLKDYEGYRELYKPYNPADGIRLTAFKRDDFIYNNPEILTDSKIKDTRLLKGINIIFTYRGNNFIWYHDDIIYLLDNKDPSKYIYETTEDTNEKQYFCFSTHDLDNSEILSEMQKLVERSQVKGLA